MSRWDSLSEESRHRLTEGDEALRWLQRHETIERWLTVGIAATELQQAAMKLAGTNDPKGRGYTEAWSDLSQHVPHLRGLDKGERSHACWLAAHWDAVDAWLKVQASNVRYSLNHPRSVRRKYEAAHKPPGEAATGKAARLQGQDAMIQLQAELDAALGKNVRAIIGLDNDSAETLADKIVDVRNADFVKRLIAALQKRSGALAMSERLEAGVAAKRGGGRKKAAPKAISAPE